MKQYYGNKHFYLKWFFEVLNVQPSTCSAVTSATLWIASRINDHRSQNWRIKSQRTRARRVSQVFCFLQTQRTLSEPAESADNGVEERS